jgi:L-threonylcarbamoyladenylate synthase
MPDHPVALAMIRAAKLPIAAPSANTSGRPSPTKAEHVAQDLDGRIELILDGGEVGIGVESTIVDMTGAIPMILRPGYITKTMLEEVLGEVRIDPAIAKINQGELITGAEPPKAPGMKYRHYAPKGELTIVVGAQDDVVRCINGKLREAREEGKITGVIATDETIVKYCADAAKSVGSRQDETGIAKELYRILREFDDEQVEVIYSEAFDTSGIGQAIMNRLLKAAGHRVVRV